ncbi:MAG: GatB/YqeY domain-containing protein [Bacteroidetes bacterium]|nr:GatB/YqeY domain-containing protein [Bacteroidota bacterium]
MNFELNIQESLKAAMRSKDQAALRALRALKSAILLAKTEAGAGDGITDEQGIKLVQKLVKQRKDSIAIYQQQSRPDLAREEEDELAILEKLLPQALSPEELESLVRDVIARTGATGKAQMGLVMSETIKAAGGRADGKTISPLVARILGQ